MLIRKYIDFTEPLTENQKVELKALKEMSDDEIFYDEDCPPTIEEELEWWGYMMKKYNTRRITKEIIEVEKTQMTDEQMAAYEYMRAKKMYIIEILKKTGGMKDYELREYLKAHPFEYEKKSA